MNKTLCYYPENKRKGSRTPYEMYNGSPQWEEIKKRIAKFPGPKKSRFLQQELDIDEEVGRTLRDTSHICVEAKKYLETLVGFNKVSTNTGKLTSKVRFEWGLNQILEPDRKNRKTREDHRHHLIDAIVVGFIGMDLVKKGSFLGEKDLIDTVKLNVDLPWKTFIQDVQEVVDNCVVDHEKSRFVKGSLHNETFYGKTDNPGVFTLRKSVHAIALKAAKKSGKGFIINKDKLEKVLADVVDVEMRQLISAKAHYLANNPEYVLKTKNGTAVHKVKMYFRKTPSTMVDLGDKAAMGGSNHYAVLWQTAEGPWAGDITSMFESARNGGKCNLSCVPEDAQRVLVLHQNDMLRLKCPVTDEINWYRVQMLNGAAGSCVFRRHNIVVKTDKDLPGYQINKSLKKFGEIFVEAGDLAYDSAILPAKEKTDVGIHVEVAAAA